MKLQINLMSGDISTHQVNSCLLAHNYSQKAIEVLTKNNPQPSESCVVVPGKLCSAMSQAERKKCHEKVISQNL